MRWLALILTLLWPLGVLAQDGAVPGLDVGRSSIVLEGEDLLVTLKLAEPAPYRLMLVAEPQRLVIDIRTAGESLGLLPEIAGADQFAALRAGPSRAGWHRLVFELRAPYAIKQSAMKTGANSQLELRLTPVAADEFVGASNAMSAMWDLPTPTTPVVDPSRPRPLRVALDPGHGGIDSGAVEGGL